ncbi:tyrosine--tRNA ligase [archaeon]|jgi:tyrosyl-tRNA synthetase|nr:tyrosine--tRNA ligase [archaeon]MBT7128565.1 tyrosine--tRNA ligase [archaeon]
MKKLSIDEKISLVKEVGEEIINEKELRELFEKKKHPIAYDGFEPSGNIHIAQGLLRAINVNKLTSTGIKFRFWVADWFGLLNNKMGGDLAKIKIVGEYFIEVWKACGMDLKNVEFVWTSEFVRDHPEYWETVLKLSMNTTVNRVLRCGQIMGREDSTSNPASQIMYPLMQAADIHHLGADIAQLGMDQRKVNMLARDVFPKMGFVAPVVVSHHMLMGLSEPKSDAENSVDRKIDIKMSKSKPDTAIFMTDSKDDVVRKFKKAFCPAGKVEDNPVLEYMKYIVFGKFDSIKIERDEKFGGDLTYDSYDDLEKAFVSGDVHPLDLKNCCAGYIDELLVPVREYFEKDERAKGLKEQVEGFVVTR